MKQAFTILVIFLCIIHIESKQNFLKRLDELKDNGIRPTLPKLLQKMRNMDSTNKVITSKIGKSGTFSWKTCENSTNLITINNLKLTPDPIIVPGSVTVEADGVLNEDLHSPVSLKLTIEKYMGAFWWLTLPCEDNLGSCTYKDVCNMIPESQCPPAFKEHNIPCKCPVKAGHYSIPGMTKPRKAPKSTERHRNPPKGTERHQNPPKGTTIQNINVIFSM